MILAAGSDVALLEAEAADSIDADDARRLITIYVELLAFHQSRLAKLSAGLIEADLTYVDERIAHRHLLHLKQRITYWQERHGRLAGISVDLDRRILSNGSEVALLTKREAQLLDFLLQQPDRQHTARILAAQAWHESGLAAEQVRTYIVRLRRILLKVDAPCAIVSQRRLGYRLTFSDGRPTPFF